MYLLAWLRLKILSATMNCLFRLRILIQESDILLVIIVNMKIDFVNLSSVYNLMIYYKMTDSTLFIINLAQPSYTVKLITIKI